MYQDARTTLEECRVMCLKGDHHVIGRTSTLMSRLTHYLGCIAFHLKEFDDAK